MKESARRTSRIRAPRAVRWMRAGIGLVACVAMAGAGAAGGGSGALLGTPNDDEARFLRVIDGESAPLGIDQEPVHYYVELSLMRAHLRLGRELYRVGDREAGRTHFIAPARVHLPAVREALEANGLERIIGRVEALAEAAEASDSWIDVQSLHQTTAMALRRAQSEVDPGLRETPRFVGDVLMAVSRRALRQHEVAIADGEVVDPVAYRSAYAYARQGERLLSAFEGLLSLADQEAYATLVERYGAFAEHWPARRAPERIEAGMDELRAGLEELDALVRQWPDN